MAGERTVVERVIDEINELADAPGTIVESEDGETVCCDEDQRRVRLLSLKPENLGLLQVVEQDEVVASTKLHLFDGTGILRTIFTCVPIGELDGEIDHVERALESDPSGGVTGEGDMDE